jgi:hypothetical protein
LGGDLAHAAEHLDIAVSEGVHTGRECLGARGELADAVLESAHPAGQIGRVAQCTDRLAERGHGCLYIGKGAGDCRVGVGAVAVAETGDLVEEAAVA